MKKFQRTRSGVVIPGYLFTDLMCCLRAAEVREKVLFSQNPRLKSWHLQHYQEFHDLRIKLGSCPESVWRSDKYRTPIKAWWCGIEGLIM